MYRLASAAEAYALIVCLPFGLITRHVKAGVTWLPNLPSRNKAGVMHSTYSVWQRLSSTLMIQSDIFFQSLMPISSCPLGSSRGTSIGSARTVNVLV